MCRIENVMVYVLDIGREGGVREEDRERRRENDEVMVFYFERMYI